MPALGSPCKARGAPECDAPNGGSLDADSAKIGARQHLSMRSIGRALGGDAHAARRRSAQAVTARFQECESMIALLPGRTMKRDANRTLLGKRGTFGNSGRGCDDAVGAGQIANPSQAFRPDARRSAVQPTRPKRHHLLLSGCRHWMDRGFFNARPTKRTALIESASRRSAPYAGCKRFETLRASAFPPWKPSS